MAYTISASEVINYEPEALRSFYWYGFEWIDNLLFLRDPDTFLGPRAAEYVVVAKERFFECGWEGDGSVQLMWLPPFAFPVDMKIPPTGVAIWHVKQVEDGVSFLLSPIQLPFDEFSGSVQ